MTICRWYDIIEIQRLTQKKINEHSKLTGYKIMQNDYTNHEQDAK